MKPSLVCSVCNRPDYKWGANFVFEVAVNLLNYFDLQTTGTVNFVKLSSYPPGVHRAFVFGALDPSNKKADPIDAFSNTDATYLATLLPDSQGP